MARTIVDMFYAGGGYTQDDSADPAYVDVAVVKDTYIQQAVSYFNALCQTVKTVSVVYTGSGASSSGDVLDDRILSELSLFFADGDYDNYHIDPDTGEFENRHWKTANDLFLNRYGIKDRRSGVVVYPSLADDIRPYDDMNVASCSY